MGSEPVPMRIPDNDPVVIELRQAVRGGDLETVGRLLAKHPGLARARFVGRKDGTGTCLHMAADWPGYFPNGAEMVRLLVGAGADPNAPTAGADPDGYAETPLHWAASTDDVDVAAALVDAGADIEALGGTIALGPPLANAVGYGCWHVARLLVARGARAGALWEAAAVGDRPRVEELLAADPPRQPTISTRRSGRPATAGSAGWPRTSWRAAPTSTPRLTTSPAVPPCR